uniref:Uncharacterized protein n=1 Tax=Oryza barthii TaxID=65489 RepID=A0A0D3HQ92_9ORYZ
MAAAAPQLEELVDLEPFSPSLFLDLPPTPHGDDPNDDDLILPFISRMLMEDDIDDKFFYQFPDHPALLHAQQPYAQILDAPSDDTTTNSSDDSKDLKLLFSAADNMEMLNMAFLKGREEANKLCTSTVDFLKAYKLFAAACCIKKVSFIFSNKTILDAVAGKRKLHIVDYGLSYGFQWPGLFKCLSEREGGPPEVRITGIDFPQPGFRPADQIEETGRRLSNCARQFGVPFRFQAIAAKWETVRREDLHLDREEEEEEEEEVLVVNCLHFLNALQDESVVVDSPSPRDMVLNNIRDMRPHVFVQCVVNGAYGAPFFLTRFRETLFFYSSQFDMLDATIPRDNDERLLIERDILGRWALNVIACEGADRVDRPETYKQWLVRNHRAGLTQLPLQPQVVELVRDKVKKLYHKDFVIDVDHNWLLQGWKGRILYAMSTWVADRDHKSLF